MIRDTIRNPWLIAAGLVVFAMRADAYEVAAESSGLPDFTVQVFDPAASPGSNPSD